MEEKQKPWLRPGLTPQQRALAIWPPDGVVTLGVQADLGDLADLIIAYEARIAELERELLIAEGSLEKAQGEMGLAMDKYAEAQDDGLERAAELVEATPEQMSPCDEGFSQGTANDLAAAIRALKGGSHG